MDDAIPLLIRSINAGVWLIVGLQLIGDDSPAVPLVRKLVMMIIIFGMWVFVVGGLVPLGVVQPWVAATVYTVFATVALMVGVALLAGPWRR